MVEFSGSQKRWLLLEASQSCAEDLVHSDKLSEHAVRLLRKPYWLSELANRLPEAQAAVRRPDTEPDE